MNSIEALYQQFDPTVPLDAEEEDLYVDWQRDVGPVNVKKQLAHSIARSGTIAVTRLFTGHRGVGKTTELKRVEQILTSGNASRRVFVSLLEAEEWLDLEDVQPADIIFHIVRQLITDLDHAGMDFAKKSFSLFFKELWDQLNREVDLKDLKLTSEVAEIGIVMKDVPIARAKLRMLLQTRLPTIFQLINTQVLVEAKKWLRQPEHGGYEDILLIVDELDRIPQKVLNEQGLTNHENIFLDHAAILRSLQCDVLFTIPIELAYSRCRQRLRDIYGFDILALPVIPLAHRDGSAFEVALNALRKIVEKRAVKAGASMKLLFADDKLADRFCRLSGGHVRNLFILLRSALDYCDDLPITDEIVNLTVRQEADSISLPLGRKEWDILKEVHSSKRPAEHTGEVWYGLLRDLFIFAYQDQEGLWYDWNPLLAHSIGTA